ncbi:MAG: class I SAM-dependent methyltransferase [Candidatus Pacearchaeota archaeon]
MKLISIYKRESPKNYKLKVKWDKLSKGRPAWIKIWGLPPRTNFICVHLGKKGIEGARIQFYKTYLPEGFFLPVDYTKEEMSKFYDEYSKNYDDSLKSTGWNIKVAQSLLKKVKKYIKKGEMLDLGAGTGLITQIFVKQGFYPATLVDYSKGMLDKAKQKKELKGCRFIKEDIRKLNLNRKYNFILSFFSFGSTSYFNKGEINKILNVAHNHLSEKGIIAIVGHAPVSEFKRKFKVLEKGVLTINKENKFYTDYFIGIKK